MKISPLAAYYAAVSEKEFQDDVLETARLTGWLVFHVNDSRKEVRSKKLGPILVGDADTKGFLDLLMIHAEQRRLLVAELKREGKDPTREQRIWLAAWRLFPFVEVYVWRPSDAAEIKRVLEGE